MNPADDIRKLFKKADLRIQPDADEQVFEDVLQAQQKTKQDLTLAWSRWRMTMKNPITKFAVAAVIAVACIAGIVIWTNTGSGIALADVLARLEQAKASRWKGEGTVAREAVPGRPERLEAFTTTTVIAQEWGRKLSQEIIEDPNGAKTLMSSEESYFLPQKKTLIHIDHLLKRYTRDELEDTTVQRIQANYVEYGDPGWFLKEITKCKYESLGRSTVDGVAVEGFRTTDPNSTNEGVWTVSQVDAKLWVDVKTRMPVRVEVFRSGLNKTEGKINTHLILHDFQWDGSVTAADFEPPPIPDGYLVVVDKLPGPITEEGAIQGLKQCVEWLGKYPGKINVSPPWGVQSELDGSTSFAAMRLKEELIGLTEQDRVNRLMEAGTPLRRVHRFFRTLNTNKKDPAYYGNIVTPQDADKILMRWKISEKEYRVIFGDLHTQTVSPEKLAQLEEAMLK